MSHRNLLSSVTANVRHAAYALLATGVIATGLAYVVPARAVPLYDFAPVTAKMQTFVQTHRLDGASLIVIQSGSPIYRQDFGTYNPATRIKIASASKWLSGLTIARLVEKGQLRWTDTVGQYFPGMPADKAGITLEQLFSHTSGLPYDDDLCLSNTNYTLATCAARILQSPLIGTPGKVFAYGGNSMEVAGRIAEIATGRAWDDLFIDEMATPLGLLATDYATNSTAPGYVRNTNPRIAGGVRSTLDDYGRVVAMLLARGCLVGAFPDQCPSGQRFLSAATLDTMARDRTIGTTTLARPVVAAGYGYGIGEWIENADGVNPQTPQPILSSPGAFGVTPWVDRTRGLAGVLLVQDQLQALSADIDDIRATANGIVATGGRRRAPVQPAIPLLSPVKQTAPASVQRLSPQASPRDRSNTRTTPREQR